MKSLVNSISRLIKRASAEDAPNPAITAESQEEENSTILYQCGEFDIYIPTDHKLPHYQQEHPLYDRFLPILASTLPQNTFVIDVGANVGDSYAAMLSSNKELQIHCIEPDPVFFQLLKTNMERIAAQLGTARPDDGLAQIYIGTTETSQGQLVSKDGSSKVVRDECSTGTINYLRLDQYLMKARRHSVPVTFIKSDVDGYDFEVLNSLGEILLEENVILYFESQCFNQYQLKQFSALLAHLQELGFEFSIFDNFGNLILSPCDAKSAISILEYTWRQENNTATRTIWYTDILANKKSTQHICQSAISSYVSANTKADESPPKSP
jgi:FkbM family methyltransferase